MEKNRISIDDVARRAKVSITTVSRVINNVSTVSAKNRVKVEEAIAHLKFKPNVSAQRLAKGVNNSIGLVMPGYPGIFYSFYAVEIIRGVGHACESLRLDMVFHITNGFNPINTHNVGGIIFADIIENRKQVEAAISMDIPCMIINNNADDLDASFIAVDNFLGGQIAAEHLVSLRHKKIAVVTGNLNTQAGLDRFNGFKNYFEVNKLPLSQDYLYVGDYSRRSARMAAEQFLKLKDRPTAIFACSDEMALEIIAVVMEKGLNVPDDISVIGFDDNPACLYGAIALTTIRQPLFEMAADSVHYLHSVITSNSDERKHMLLSPELIVRDSCKPAAG